VHQPGKGDALRLLEGPRENPSEGLNDCKECTKDKISSYYKLRREECGVSRESDRRSAEGHGRTENLEGFKPRKI
jgi:hypothetical protein